MNYQPASPSIFFPYCIIRQLFEYSSTKSLYSGNSSYSNITITRPHSTVDQHSWLQATRQMNECYRCRLKVDVKLSGFKTVDSMGLMHVS